MIQYVRKRLRRSGRFCGLAMLGWATAVAGVLPDDWNAKAAADMVLRGLKNTTAPQIKGAHDAELVIVKGKAYIVAEVNDTQAGESPERPKMYVSMSVVDVASLTHEATIPVTRGEQKFENVELPVGACFAPRIIPRDDGTLRCYFTSERPRQRQSQRWYRDFDLRSQTFASTIHQVKLKTRDGRHDMQPQYFYADAVRDGFRGEAKDYGLCIVDSFKVFDGRIYVVLNNFPGRQNALATLNDAMDTFEVLGHFNEPQSVQLAALPDLTALIGHHGV